MSIQDEALEGKVRGALSQDKRLSGLPIVPRAADGEIHLKGRVDNQEQRDLAEMVVNGVPGVRGVVSDELVVPDTEDTEDME